LIPLIEIARARVPGQAGADITLLKRGSEFSIRTAGKELMNSRLHASEALLARLTCDRLERREGRRLLIGGLGMGYTLAAALEQLEPDAHITVSELVAAVIEWNRKYIGHLAGRPLDDPRVSLVQEDVAETIGRKRSAWDAILLDVDNGPDGLTRKANDRLYAIPGLKTFALRAAPRRDSGHLVLRRGRGLHPPPGAVRVSDANRECACPPARKRRAAHHLACGKTLTRNRTQVSWMPHGVIDASWRYFLCFNCIASSAPSGRCCSLSFPAVPSHR
jgi:hypothetical protein